MSRADDILSDIVSGGTNHVHSMITNLFTEELFLDYKRSADNGSGSVLQNTDRANLSKAISGFGNSEGGVILWGVDCRTDKKLGDVPSGAVPITNPVRFKSWLEQATTGTTVPPHDGVRHEALVEPGKTSGFVATLVPKGLHAPYQTIPDLRYMMRSGSNFAPVPHGVLAGMFGRRPQPNVYPTFVTEQNFSKIEDIFTCKFGIAVHNAGPGIASDAYLNIHIVSTGGVKNTVSIESDSSSVWTPSVFLNRMWNFILKTDYKLSPEATSLPAIARMKLVPPFTGNLRIKISAGADQAVPYRSEMNVGAEELSALYDAVRNAPSAELFEASRNLVERILKM